MFPSRLPALALIAIFVTGHTIHAEEAGIPGALDVLLGPEMPTDAAESPKSSAEALPPERGPAQEPPSGPLVKNAERVIREAFAAEIAAAQSTGEGRRLVTQLIEIVDQPSLTAVERFAAANVAINVAMEGMDPDVVRNAVSARAEWFTGQDAIGTLLDFATKAADENRFRPESALAFCLQVGREAYARGQPEAALRASTLAAASLRRLPANDADRFRAAVQDLDADANGLMGIWNDAARAEQTLDVKPGDLSANVRLAFRIAWGGDWAAANTHFLKGNNVSFKAAAVLEQQLNAESDAEAVLETANHWWNATVNAADAPSPLDGDPPPTAPPIVMEAIRQHAADLYERALACKPGPASPIDRKLAESRVAAAGKEQPRELDVATQRFRQDGPGADIELQVGEQGFVEHAFNTAEAKRFDLFRQLGRAVRAGGRGEIARLHRELTENRQQWCQSLHLYNRDESLPRKQQLVANVLRADPNCADALLCDCYLKMLDGKRGQALESLNRADTLMNQEPLRQLFCGQQLLDAGSAALLLGEQERAEKLRTFFRKGPFSRDPGVKTFEARIYTEKSMFSEAIKNLEEAMRAGGEANRALIAADYAWLKAAAPVGRLRDAGAANAAIKEALASASGQHWKAWRARAALLAAEGKWPEAIATLDKAVRQAPLLFADELEEQRRQYLSQEDYWITRK